MPLISPPRLVLALACLLTSCDRRPPPDYRTLYDSLETDPFDADLVERAMDACSRAEGRNSKDPWAYILGSYAHLRAGYTHGDPLKSKNYSPPSIAQARRLADKVGGMCPDRPECLVPAIRLDIIENRLEAAKSRLNRTYLIDSTDFYVWYYRAEIESRIGQTKNAQTHLDDAQRLAKHPWHQRWVVDSRIDLAAGAKNDALVDSLYRELIRMDTSNPYSYGNFGGSLLHRQRPAEAIGYLEKAVALRPYPLALERLKEAKAKASEVHP